jgi:hypothetical protein
VAIDIERDVQILQMQMRSGGIVEPGDLAAGQDQPPHGLGIPDPALKQIAQVQHADLVRMERARPLGYPWQLQPAW